jgi:hypothetical protein
MTKGMPLLSSFFWCEVDNDNTWCHCRPFSSVVLDERGEIRQTTCYTHYSSSFFFYYALLSSSFSFCYEEEDDDNVCHHCHVLMWSCKSTRRNDE